VRIRLLSNVQHETHDVPDFRFSLLRPNRQEMVIPSIFLNSTLRFSLLRIIVLSALVLIWNVPTLIIYPSVSALCSGPGKAYPFTSSMDAANGAYRMKCLVYAYGLYSLTVAHHVAR
jgi:hypothetical protein